MKLQNLHLIGHKGTSDIIIDNNGNIERIVPNNSSPKSYSDRETIEFNDAMAFPGLINSHDHLEFNLFPQLGNTIYKNYTEWGADIHKQNKATISGITKIPRKLRAEWGLYKNLLNGITTVIHHGKYVKPECSLIDVYQDCHSLHSVSLEKHWKLKLNNPFAKRWPYVIHTGEGTDRPAAEEINELIKWNLFKRKLIAVHGVAMTPEQAGAFQALIWCPDANFFLLNTTARIDELKKETKILFGTDSTISSNWSIWDQIRLARTTSLLTDNELFHSLTNVPASTWNLNDRGMLIAGKCADMVIARMKTKGNAMSSFFEINAEDILLILKKGNIIMFDDTLKQQLKNHIISGEFENLSINDVSKCLKGNLIELIKEIKKHNPEIDFPINF